MKPYARDIWNFKLTKFNLEIKLNRYILETYSRYYPGGVPVTKEASEIALKNIKALTKEKEIAEKQLEQLEMREDLKYLNVLRDWIDVNKRDGNITITASKKARDIIDGIEHSVIQDVEMKRLGRNIIIISGTVGISISPLGTVKINPEYDIYSGWGEDEDE